MAQEIDQQEIAKRYLLGKLSEAERERFEEQYFVDDSEFEQLEIAEDELIEQYVREELSADETRQFEKLLVSPGISERVEVARLIAKKTVPVSRVVTTPAFVPVQPVSVGWWERFFGSALRPAFAMSVILMLLTTIGLVFVWTKLRSESQRLAQEQQQREQLQQQIDEQKARFDQLAAKLDKTEKEKQEQADLAAKYQQLLAEQQQQRSVTALAFPIYIGPSGGTRGGGEAIAPIKLPNGVPRVSLNLNVTHGDYPSYTASVRNIDSPRPVTTKSNLKPFTERGRKYIKLDLDATALRPGSYSVYVEGITAEGQKENFDDYSFRITSK